MKFERFQRPGPWWLRAWWWIFYGPMVVWVVPFSKRAFAKAIKGRQ